MSASEGLNTVGFTALSLSRSLFCNLAVASPQLRRKRREIASALSRKLTAPSLIQRASIASLHVHPFKRRVSVHVPLRRACCPVSGPPSFPFQGQGALPQEIALPSPTRGLLWCSRSGDRREPSLFPPGTVWRLMKKGVSRSLIFTGNK